MGYKNISKFIPIIETTYFKIGNLDYFFSKVKQLIHKKILKKNIFSIETEDDFLKKISLNFSASIVKKIEKIFIGFISIYEIDYTTNSASIIFVTDTYLDKKSIEEILEKYKEFIRDYLMLNNIENTLIINNYEIEYIYENFNEHIKSPAYSNLLMRRY